MKCRQLNASRNIQVMSCSWSEQHHRLVTFVEGITKACEFLVVTGSVAFFHCALKLRTMKRCLLMCFGRQSLKFKSVMISDWTLSFRPPSCLPIGRCLVPNTWIIYPPIHIHFQPLCVCVSYLFQYLHTSSKKINIVNLCAAQWLFVWYISLSH